MNALSLRLRVARRVDEADRIVSVVLERPERAPLPSWEPGAHLEVVLPSGTIRQYSLSGDPREPLSYTLTVQREDGGRGGSAEFHTVAQPGTYLDVRGPRNNFRLGECGQYLFLAGGIGITPLRPMIQVTSERGGRWRLVYGGRSRASMAFAAELAERHPDQVAIVAEDELGWPDFAAEMAWLGPDAEVYACGPAGMLDAVTRAHASAGLPAAVRFERFSAGQPAENRSEPAADREFDVHLARSDVTVHVGADQSVLAAVLAVAPETSFSCEEGYCGTCETKVLEGVADHRDTFLTDDERENTNTMMICVSRCAGDRLVLDL